MVWVLGIGAIILLVVLYILYKTKILNAYLFSIFLFLVLLVFLIVSIYGLCDYFKADDYIKELIRSSLPAFCAFVSAVVFFASESDREDIYKRKSVQPYLYIEDYETSSYCCEFIKLKNAGSGSACNIVLDFGSIKYNDLQQKCIRVGESDEIKNIKPYKGDNQSAEIIYKDIYDNTYKQEIKFNVENNVTAPTLSSPKYVTKKELREMEKKQKQN